MKKDRLKTIAFSLAFASIVAFGAGHNEIVDTLILVGVWILICLGFLASILMGFGIFALSVADDVDATDDAVQKWKNTDRPKWFISIPLTLIWLTALVHAGWHATAVVYFIQTLIMWFVMWLLFQTIDTFIKKSDPLDFIKNPEVKDAILKSRKPIIGLDETGE